MPRIRRHSEPTLVPQDDPFIRELDRFDDLAAAATPNTPAADIDAALAATLKTLPVTSAGWATYLDVLCGCTEDSDGPLWSEVHDDATGDAIQSALTTLATLLRKGKV